MVDKFSRETRSRIMAAIKGKNTNPEMAVRKILWSRGIRYRIHDNTVFGTPDISNKRKKLAIFIDGCFWHGCKRCYRPPKSNVEYWKNKIVDNKKRRSDVLRYLRKDGWMIFQFWEHEVISNPDKVAMKIENSWKRN